MDSNNLKVGEIGALVGPMYYLVGVLYIKQKCSTGEEEEGSIVAKEEKESSGAATEQEPKSPQNVFYAFRCLHADNVDSNGNVIEA